MSWEAVIGLEIHAQLATQSKIFSASSTAYGAAPNTQASAIDLGLPGVLPVLNESVVRMAVIFGVAVDATIADGSVFARKNYFYPDLPKGYQISQYEDPIVSHGKIDIQLEDGLNRTIDITRAHLEEDAGKSVHENFADYSGIDLNRAGTPLLEIVSEPQLHSAKEAVAYMKAMHTLVRYLGICDGNMQEGSFRCDANVSVRRTGEALGTRAEIKNLNSFRFVERAIDFEIERQIDLIEGGGEVVQETRLYDSDRDETRSMRGKEDAHDYRYFPDPDLLPIPVSSESIAEISASLPELPAQKRKRFLAEYGLNDQDAETLTQDKDVACFFEEVVRAVNGDAKLAANWVTGELFGALNRANLTVSQSPVSGANLGQLLLRISDDTISGKIAKQVFETMWDTGNPADAIIADQGLQQVSGDDAIIPLIEQVLQENPEQIEQYRAGKQKVFGFFVGQVMKLSKGQANPKQVNDILKSRLNES